MLLPILTNPNPALRKKSKSVRVLTPELRVLIRNMAETMYNAKGVGLAAPQVGYLLKIIIVDISKEQNELVVLINPKIVEHSREVEVKAEGCLSVPGFEGDIERFKVISVKAMNWKGESISFEAYDFFARAIQHEIDHLNGHLYIDSLYGNTELRPLEPEIPLE